MCHVVLAHNKHAGGVHINPVHDARTHDPVNAGQLVLAVIHQAVDQGMAVMPCSRMDHHSLWFVNQYDVPVLIKDVQVHGFGLNLRLHCLRHIHLNMVIRCNHIAGFYETAVNQDLP